MTGKGNAYDDERKEPAGTRFTSIQRHLTPSRKIVRPTVLINGHLTAWRIVAGKEEQRWRISVLSESREMFGISTKNYRVVSYSCARSFANCIRATHKFFRGYK